jgi:hypothetical protein
MRNSGQNKYTVNNAASTAKPQAMTIVVSQKEIRRYRNPKAEEGKSRAGASRFQPFSHVRFYHPG